jgi:oligopeptide/dipeptide ABC transporter ATP-binding protein
VHRSGTVIFDGKELTKMAPDDVRNEFGTGMAMIFQDPMTALNPVRRIGSQLGEGLRIRLGMDKKAAIERSKELLAFVRIPEPEEMLRKFPNQLSGGMRQRVMIAIAIACNPKLLFADEPTTALDVTVQAQILDLLSDLRQELTMSMVLVTHALMKSIPRLDMPSGQRLPVISGRLPDPTKPEPGCPFANRCPYVQNQCRTEAPPMVLAGPEHGYRCWFPIGGAH